MTIAHRQPSGPCVDLLDEACFGLVRPTHRELDSARHALLYGVDAASMAGADAEEIVAMYYTARGDE